MERALWRGHYGRPLNSQYLVVTLNILSIPYGGKFSRGSIFVDWGPPKFAGGNIRGQHNHKPHPLNFLASQQLRGVVSMSSFTVETVVRGFHIYKEVWHAVIGDVLPCRRDLGNPHDLYAVAMVRASNTVGHVPRRISSVCSIFLRRGGSISCTITGIRQYSGDLPQGGLEVPCLLKFEGDEKEVIKAEKLIKSTLSSSQDEPAAGDKRKEEEKSDKSVTDPNDESQHGHLPAPKKKKLSHVTGEQLREIETSIIRGDLLSDLPINLAQYFLRSQFPQIKGLQSTLLQSRKEPSLAIKQENKLQIIHSRGNHWIVVSSIGCETGVVNVHDSIYEEIDSNTQEVVFNIFGTVDINFVQVQKQRGGSDCGLFAIAISIQ